MRKREWIVVLGTTALVIILFSIGSFFLYWGLWNYLFGYGTRPVGLENVLIFWGGGMVIIGIVIVLKLVAFLSRQRESSSHRRARGVTFFE